jgi:hypothetical protein
MRLLFLATSLLLVCSAVAQQAVVMGGLANVQPPIEVQKLPPVDRKEALLFSSSDTLPHIASSGTWDAGVLTVFQVVNHSPTQSHPFVVRFYDDNGDPLRMTILANSSGSATLDATGFQGVLGPSVVRHK